jgi:hypothetical protein
LFPKIAANQKIRRKKKMNKNEGNEASGRMPIIASEINHLGQLVTEIIYEAVQGTVTRKVPREAVEVINLPDGRILTIVSKLTTAGGVFKPEFVFREDLLPVPPTDTMAIELTDMVQQDASTVNIREYLKQFAHVDTTKSQEIDESEEALHASLFQSEEIQVEQDEQVSVVEDGDQYIELPEWMDGEEVAWDGALIAGGRVNKTAPWDFTPTFLPNHVVVDGKAIRVNKKDGAAGSWTVLNPELASEKRPAGALLGSVSDRYYTLGHPVWVKPMLKYSEMSGIKSSVTSWNEGAKCRVDLDVTQATQLRKSATQRLKDKGHGQFLDTDSLSEAAQSLDGLYKFGFVINNSLDGRGSFGAYGAALRTYCQNLAVAGGIETAIKMRHTRGVMQDVDWDEFGLNLVNATAEMNEWLVNTELMSWIPVDLQLMDKLLSVMEKESLMTAPRMVKNKDTGLITQVNRSHMDLAVTQGWKQPTLSYVSVRGEQQNTLYHALQCVTGAMTHKPTVHDDKRELKGSTLGIDTLDNRLKKVSSLFGNIAAGALDHAMTEINGSVENKLSLEQKDDVKGFLTAHPEALGLVDVPQFSEAHEIAVL